MAKLCGRKLELPGFCERAATFTITLYVLSRSISCLYFNFITHSNYYAGKCNLNRGDNFG